MRHPNVKFTPGGMPFAHPIPGEPRQVFEERAEEIREIWSVQRKHAREVLNQDSRFIIG